MRGVPQGRQQRLRRTSRIVALVLGATTLCSAVRAQNATWLVNPSSNDFDTGANWNLATVPSGTAFFGTSSITSLTFSTDTTIGSWTFNAGAANYTFSNSNTLIFTGAGIVINGGSAAITNYDNLYFEYSSTAGSAAITNDAFIYFNDTSTAGNATVVNSGGIEFYDSSTAGTAIITNYGDTYFNSTSTAGSATITNNGYIFFYNTSTAGSAAITNNDFVSFYNTSTAGSAAIINDSNSLIFFYNTSTAGSAAFTNNGRIIFVENSTAGSATIINNLAGTVDFSDSNGPLGNNQLTAGSIAGAGVFYLGANQLTVGGNNLSTTVSGVISDCGTGGTACQNSGATGGSLVKVGTGTLTLTGANTYTGATTIDGGTLVVNGSIADTSSVTVNAGGTLSGTGTIDPATTTIMSNGILAPGPPGGVGTLTISGDLVFESATTYLVTVSGATASNTSVSGTASLGGNVQVTFASAPTVKSYEILQSSGLGGSMFSDVTAPNYSATLSYPGNDVFLNITGAALGNTSGLNQNEQNAANAISNFFNSGGTLPTTFANLFNLTGAPLQSALTQLDGEDATGAATSGFTLMDEFLELMLGQSGAVGGAPGGNGGLGFAPDQQADALPPELALAYDSILKAPPKQSSDQRWSTWASGFGGGSFLSGNAAVGSNNVNANTYGSAAGMEYRPDPNTRIGFALAGSGLSWGLADNLGTGRSDAFQAGVYTKSYFGPAYISAALAFGNNWFTTNRTALGDQLTATFTGQSYAARAEGGYRFAVPLQYAVIGVTPYAALQTQWFHTPAYSETDLTGGGLGLAFNSTTANDTRSELGARFDDLTTWNNKPLVLRASLAWAHDWESGTALNAAFESLPGSTFAVNGAPLPPDSALTSASAQYFFTSNWSFTARFDGEFAPGGQTYAGSGTLNYTW